MVKRSPTSCGTSFIASAELESWDVPIRVRPLPFSASGAGNNTEKGSIDMKNFARGALVVVAAVSVIGGVGAGAASAHPAGALDSPSLVNQSWVDIPFGPHHPHHPHPIGPHRIGPNSFGPDRGGPTERPGFLPFPWGICPNVSPQGHCFP
jgi:hypothetical protein